MGELALLVQAQQKDRPKTDGDGERNPGRCDRITPVNRHSSEGQ